MSIKNKITEGKINVLIPDDLNANKGTEFGQHLVEESLRKFGAGRSILLDKNNRIIAGNKTIENAGSIGLEDIIIIETTGNQIIAVKRTDIDLDSKQGREMAIADNATAKVNISWDDDVLQVIEQRYPEIDLVYSGVEFPDIIKNNSITDDDSEENDETSKEDKQKEVNDRNFFESKLNDCIYPSNNSLEIPTLDIAKQAGNLILPVAPWGADSRLRKDVSTYHFYTDDYRFEAIFKDPIKLLVSGVKQIVEPNLSLYDTTPIAYGLSLIYKKRWISRYFQECNIKVYADLNVSQKFYEYNILGLPEGWNAFFTRGYSDRIEYLKMEHEIARRISGLQVPNLCVYGGGRKINDYCLKNNLIYIEQFINDKK